jgi:AraC family transcriptional regulator of adaptative response / DNA-3-methyladenine glycosylase II
MTLDPDSCYRALTAHDARFDGRFFVGVRSTRIYCRPVCNVRLPRRENCRFFVSAAAAEVEGYRPCLRCRPELAPGLASIDASGRLAHAAAEMIENGALETDGFEALAARVGVTSRHLRRVFAAEFGVAPIEYAQTQRLLLAKRLLTDTVIPVTDVALASGFRSLRRFNALVRARYRMAPSRLRRDAAPRSLPATMRFELAYRPPFDWDGLLAFLAPRAIRGVERVAARTYARTLTVETRSGTFTGWLTVRPATRRNALVLDVSASLARAIPDVLARARHAFDLACDPARVVATLGELAAACPGLRVPGTFDGFELAVRAVVGQQVSVAGATTLLGRLADAFGDPSDGVAPDGLARFFPMAATLAQCDADALRGIGLTSARARTLIDLARAVDGGTVSLRPGADVEHVQAALAAIRGIGPWTASYIAMRALGWPDAFLEGDLGVLRALGETRASRARARSEAWRPWRAYAVMHLWRRLGAAGIAESKRQGDSR